MQRNCIQVLLLSCFYFYDLIDKYMDGDSIYNYGNIWIYSQLFQVVKY